MTDPKRYSNLHDQPDPYSVNPIGERGIDAASALNMLLNEKQGLGFANDPMFRGAYDRQINSQLRQNESELTPSSILDAVKQYMMMQRR